MELNDIPIKQVGLPIWELDYSVIEDKSIRDKYIEFAEYSRKKLLTEFKNAFGIDFFTQFEFVSQIPEGSDCLMTQIAEEEYTYRHRDSDKLIHIYINFRCNRKCVEIFNSRQILIYRLEAYKYFTPDIIYCDVELVYDLQKNREYDFDYDRLDNINNGDIEKYLIDPATT